VSQENVEIVRDAFHSFGEMGHTDPALALRVYRQAMRRGENEKAALRKLVDGPELPSESGREPSPTTAK